jgi:hypothetical protein
MNFTVVSNFRPKTSNQTNLNFPTQEVPLVEIASREVFYECAETTAKSVQLLVDPRFSLFIQGVKMMAKDDRGGFLSGFENGIGFLLVLASPVAGILKIGILAPIAVISAAATGVAGIATGVEWTGRKIKRKIDKSNVPSPAETARKHTTEQFVTKLHEILKRMPYAQSHFYKENPAQLISLGLISVAFLSRNLDTEGLKVGHHILTKEMVNGQDANGSYYFKTVCEMKDALRSLNLSLYDEQAWDQLMQSIENLGKTPLVNTQDTEDALTLFMQYTLDLSKKVHEDIYFKKAWENSLL